MTTSARHILAPRDVLIYKKLVECRVMARTQLIDLFFPGRSETAVKRRTKFLQEEEIIGTVEQSGIYVITQKLYIPKPEGAVKIARFDTTDPDEFMEQLQWDGRKILPSLPTLPHILDIAEVNVQFTKALREHGGTLTTWLNESTLFYKHMPDKVTIPGVNDEQITVSIIPDAYFTFTIPSSDGEHTYNHFLELDRGTETQREIARKVYAYIAYMKQPDSLYEQRYPKNESKGRVVFIALGYKRLQNMKKVCEDCGGKSRFWFTTLQDLINNDPLIDPIWYKAGSTQLFSFIW